MSGFSTGLNEECTRVSSKSSTRVLRPLSDALWGPRSHSLPLVDSFAVGDFGEETGLYKEGFVSFKRNVYLHSRLVASLWDLANELTKLVLNLSFLLLGCSWHSSMG